MTGAGAEPPLGLETVEVAAVGDEGGDGVHWTLEVAGDLNVNVVRLGAGSAIGAHRNDEVDVVVLVQHGDGVLEVDGHPVALAPHHLAHVPRGAVRAVSAGADGITYVTVHRRRGPLAPGRRPPG